MSLAVLAPYRPDTVQRIKIKAATQRLWEQQGVEVVYADDGLDGPYFSYARAANRARRRTDADVLVVYNVDAIPLPNTALDEIGKLLAGGCPWSVLFKGQHRYTAEQTRRLVEGASPGEVGPPQGRVDLGCEALLAVRADVWDGLRGMDERFVGWGPEDKAWYQVLSTVHPDGVRDPRYGLFWSLWHPAAPRAAFEGLMDLWRREYPRDVSPEEMRAWYLSRP